MNASICRSTPASVEETRLTVASALVAARILIGIGLSLLLVWAVLLHPTSWFRATQQLTPHLSDPHEILALGTYPLRPGGPNCAQFPANAIRDLGPEDALIWLAERTGPGDAPPRPESFVSAISAQGTDESPACLSSKKDFTHRVIAFSDAGRIFELYVAYGHSLPAPRFAELLAILDGLRFDRSS